jgi:pyruvate/2-oxoglutarate/acetoin dehydrogenase E1 component
MYFRVVLIEYISVMFQISFAVSFNKIILSCSRFWLLLQAIDHIINSAAKSNYMSAGQISVPIVFRGPNGAAAGVGAQHSHVWLKRFLIHLSFCKHTYSLSQAAHFILSLSLSLSFESQMF